MPKRDCATMFFPRHDFTKWEIEARGTVHRSGGPDPSGEYTVGNWIRQSRRCNVCGLTQLRLDKATN